jgi:uncharacterized membrane protein YkoI
MGKRTMMMGAMILAACGGGAAESSGSSSSTVTESSSTTLSFADALSRAEAAYPGTSAFEVEYEEHEGRRVVEVEVVSGAEVREVYYDPSTGDVVHEASETPEADEALALPTIRDGITAGTLSMRRSIELATSTYPAASIEAVELQVENGTAVVSILVREAAGVTRYVHDAASGALISNAPGTAEHAE